MSDNELGALRLGGWILGKGSHHHPSGAIIRIRAGISATRPDGTTRRLLANLTEAAAWARGLLGDEVGSPPAHVERSNNRSARVPPGWTYANGLYRHREGRVERGHATCKFLAMLNNNKRQMFRLREDALRWVEARGEPLPATLVEDKVTG